MDQCSIHLFRGIIPLPLSDCLEKLWKAIFSNLAVIVVRLLPSNPKRTGSPVTRVLFPLPHTHPLMSEALIFIEVFVSIRVTSLINAP